MEGVDRERNRNISELEVDNGLFIEKAAVLRTHVGEDCQECVVKESIRHESQLGSQIPLISSSESYSQESSWNSRSSKEPWRMITWGRRGNGARKKGSWSWSTVLVFTVAVLMLLLSFSEVSAKGDVMPEDDFDSSNKKVKFEDFDTNVTPMPVSGGGVAAGGTLESRSEKVRDAGAVTSLGFIHAFVASFSVIVVSELGDKTFFIAAIMAMRHPRFTVFAGAISALALMTILSALFGYATTIIPKAITYYISTALFAIFGVKMIYDGFRMSADEGAEELEEVQATLRRRDDDNNDIESQASKDVPEVNQGYRLPSPIRRVLFTLFSRVFLQALTMTFLAEWGDRSQIATIILAAREDVPGVCIGGILGHSCCTGLAVLGGRMVAQKISVRTVTIIGGVVFLVFAVTSLFFNPDSM